MNTRPQVTVVPYSPENKGQIFSQQVMPPSEVYWPMITSRKNTGRPPPNRKIKYGMRNAPVERAEWGEGQTGLSQGQGCRCLLQSPPSQWNQREQVRDMRVQAKPLGVVANSADPAQQASPFQCALSPSSNLPGAFSLGASS